MRMKGVLSHGIGHYHPIPSEGPFGSIPCGLSSFYPRVSLEKLYQNFFCGLLVANWDVISRHHFMHIAPFCGSYLSAHQPIMWWSLQSVAIRACISDISPNSGRDNFCTLFRCWDEIFDRSQNWGHIVGPVLTTPYESTMCRTSLAIIKFTHEAPCFFLNFIIIYKKHPQVLYIINFNRGSSDIIL